MTTTLTINTDRLPVSHLSDTEATLAHPAEKDYPAGKAIVSQVCGILSRLEWKQVEAVRAGETSVRLADYAGYNYFDDCLGDKWRK